MATKRRVHFVSTADLVVWFPLSSEFWEACSCVGRSLFVTRKTTSASVRPLFPSLYHTTSASPNVVRTWNVSPVFRRRFFCLPVFQMVLQYKGLPFKLTPVGPDAKVVRRGKVKFCRPTASDQIIFFISTVDITLRKHTIPPVSVYHVKYVEAGADWSFGLIPASSKVSRGAQTTSTLSLPRRVTPLASITAVHPMFLSLFQAGQST